jgi:hypothetical protein
VALADSVAPAEARALAARLAGWPPVQG